MDADILISNYESYIGFRLISILSNSKANDFFNYIKKEYRAYIFGGVIKDFIFKREGYQRDIDIVIDSFDLKLITYIEKLDHRKNQFGGYKLHIDNFEFDLWQAKDTWAIKNFFDNNIDYDDVFKILPDTSFFNITAVLYSINDENLVYNNDFKKFLNDKELDIVFEENPYPELCLVKTFQFSQEFDLKISERLENYFIKNYKTKRNLIEDIQKKHYGEVKYKIEDIDLFFSKIVRKQKRKLINNKIDNQLTFQFLD